MLCAAHRTPTERLTGMASLPFVVICISPASHRNSLEAAWLDHHLHHRQRVVNLRNAHGSRPSHNASAPTVKASSSRSQAQASPHLHVSAVQEETEGEIVDSSRSWPSAIASGSSLFSNRSCSSSPEADNVDMMEDICGVVVEDRNASSSGRQSEIAGLSEQLLQVETGEDGLWSVVIPTYDRLPILTKCLRALEEQVEYELGGIAKYEVIVVDDGSTDGTIEFLSGERAEVYEDDSQTMTARWAEESGPKGRREKLEKAGTFSQTGQPCFAQQSKRFPHVKLIQQKHAGATTARNLGLKHANGAIIVFIDSDLVVTRKFLRAHGEALREAFREDGDDRAFTYGRVINTSNFENPQSEKVKITDYSAAFFATGNVAISRRRLMEAVKLLGPDADGPFDALFSEYGWEDLELGVRLKQLGARIKHAPDAIGYHWHPAFSVDHLPKLIEQEKQRGRNGVRFYQKHPNLNVQLMIQMTPFHELLWFVLTLGGLLNERTLEPILRQLEMKDMNQIAAALVSPVLNWHTVQAVKEEAKRLKVLTLGSTGEDVQLELALQVVADVGLVGLRMEELLSEIRSFANSGC